MKSAVLVLVVLFASLFTYGQDSKPAPIPAPPTQTTPVQPVPQKVQPVIEAGGLDSLCQSGLDSLCQSGLGGHYNFGKEGFGSNNPAESKALSDASACIGYITGWAHSISGAFITEDNKLWYVEINDQFNVTVEANALHAFLQANPDARTAASPLVLLTIAVEGKTAIVAPVDIRDFRPDQPQNNEQGPAETLKSTT